MIAQELRNLGFVAGTVELEPGVPYLIIADQGSISQARRAQLLDLLNRAGITAIILETANVDRLKLYDLSRVQDPAAKAASAAMPAAREEKAPPPPPPPKPTR